MSSGGRAVDHAQDRSDRELAAGLQPGLELAPCPAVHADFAALASLATADEHSATAAVKIALLQIERFADAEPGAPEEHDQGAESRPSARSPTVRITATISSTVGGSAG